MLKSISALIILTLSSFSFAMQTRLDPWKISTQPSQTAININGQNQIIHYVIHDGKIIFRISDNLIPSFNSLITKSGNDNNMIAYNLSMVSNPIISYEQLLNVISVPDEVGKFVEVTANDIIISQNILLNYSIKFTVNGTKFDYKINKFVYKEMKKILSVASNQRQTIKMNLDFFPIFPNFRDRKTLNANIWTVAEKK
jgi:hypothetical protein